MTPDTKRQIKNSGATVAVIAAALAGGVFLSDNVVPPGPLPVTTFETVTMTRAVPTLATNAPRVRFSWSDSLTPEDVRAGWITDVYGTTNFRNFAYVGSTGSNSVTISASRVFEGFITRHRHTNSGYCTPWNRKKL